MPRAGSPRVAHQSCFAGEWLQFGAFCPLADEKGRFTKCVWEHIIKRVIFVSHKGDLLDFLLSTATGRGYWSLRMVCLGLASSILCRLLGRGIN